jgi:hypothetical protein
MFHWRGTDNEKNAGVDTGCNWSPRQGRHVFTQTNMDFTSNCPSIKELSSSQAVKQLYCIACFDLCARQ